MASLAPAAAQDPHAEIFTGLDASNNAVSSYLGAGYAFGKGLYAPGWRVRAVDSLGSYDYRGTLFGGGSDLSHDTQCEPGNVCLDGNCTRAHSSSDVDDVPVKRSPSKGKTCGYDDDCDPGARCIKGSGPEGVCIGH